MVLSAVQNDAKSSPELEGVRQALDELDVDSLKFADIDGAEDTFDFSVYGSKFAAQELPRNEMPKREMPREVAYRMIKDDLSLDGAPTLKYAMRASTANYGR